MGENLIVNFLCLPVSKASDHENSIHGMRVYCQGA